MRAIPRQPTRKIAFTTNGKGLLFVPNPDGRKIPSFFTFNKSGTINDKGLVDVILEEFKIEVDEQTGANFKLEMKPFGPIEGYTLYKLEL